MESVFDLFFMNELDCSHFVAGNIFALPCNAFPYVSGRFCSSRYLGCIRSSSHKFNLVEYSNHPYLYRYLIRNIRHKPCK